MLLAALAIPASAQLPAGYIFTDQSGAQPTVSITAAQKIQFSTTFPYNLSGARITMKADGGITEPITITFYDGPVTLSGGSVVGSPTVLRTATLTAAEFAAQGSVNQYSLRAFDVAPYTTTANQVITAVLTSNANGQNYFVKLNSPCVSDSAGTCLVPPPPDMGVTLATSPGSLVAGNQASITGTYTNSGQGATSGTVTGTITIPAGWTGLSVVASGWNCGTPTAGATLTCTRTDSLNPSTSYPTITVTGTIPAGPAGTFSTTATVSATGDTNSANNTASLSNVSFLGSPDLSVTLTAAPSPLSASSSATLTLAAQNVGGSPTVGQVTATITIPAGWTGLSTSGSGWNCPTPVAGSTLSCTRNDALNASASYPNLVVTGTVAPNSPTPITLTGTIGGGNDYNAANNSQTITPTVLQPNLSISVTASPNPLNAASTGTITVSTQNIGAAPTGGLVTVTVTIPAGWTSLNVTGSGWTCGTPTAGATLSCTRSDALAASGSYPNIVVTGTVNPSSPGTIAITGTVTGGGDTTPVNNTTTINPTVYLPDLQVTLTSSPDPLVAGAGGTITVATQNTGAAPTNGTVTLQIAIPAGWTNLGLTANGWTCGTPTAGATLTCTRNDALAGGSSYPNVVVTGTVPADSPNPLTLTANVSGGGDTNLVNNTSSQGATVNFPDLRPSLTSAPNPLVAGYGGSLVLTIENIGNGAHNGLVTATIAVPANWTALSWTGSGWTCLPNVPVAGQNLVCTRSDVLAASATYPAITVSGTVPVNATSPLNVNANVNGANDNNPGNNSTSGSFTVTPGRSTAAFSCVGNAGVPPLVRAEGLSELVGDLVLNCTGGNPTGQGTDVPRANVQIFLNTNITGRLNSSDSAYSEALLMIDEPAHGSQKLCSANGGCALTGTGTVNGVNYADGNNPNVFLGRQVGANSIVWLGVPIDPPGPNATRVIRITNVRANANQLGVSSTLIPTQIVMFVSVTGSTAMPINNPQQTVAFVQPGLSFSTRSAASSYLQCVSFNKSAATDSTATLSDGLGTIVRFSEGFASSFKRRNTAAYAFDGASPQPVQQNVPGAIYNTESGFYAPNMTILNSGSTASTAAANAGLADSGTRLMARFANVPAGISLYATVYPVGSSTSIDANCLGPSAGGACIKSVNNSSSTSLTQARLISTDSNGAGGFSGVTATATTKEGAGVAPLTLNNGSGMAVWEVLNADPLTSQTYEFGVGVAFASNTSSNLPGLGSATVAGGFAPLSSVTTASSSAPIPRFADTSSARSIFTVNPCTTNLLFVFLSNQSGFDSGIAISNTSSDPHGTAPQAGPCKLNYYGETAGGGAAPAAQTSAVVPAGKQLVAVLSTGGNYGIAATPGFQGYMIAQCQFQYAHGLAYVSDIGANRVAESYQAFVLDSALGSRTGFSSEVLGH